MSIANYIKRKQFWIKDWYTGTGMWNDFKEIKFIYENPEEGEQIRQNKLNALLKFADTHVPFYKKLGVKSLKLEDYPVVNKQTYLSNYNVFLTPVDDIPGQKGNIHIQRTSGSTGTPFELPQDTRCRVRRIATIKFGNELIGFHSFEPMVHLRSLKHYYKGNPTIVHNKDVNIIYADNAEFTDKKIENIIDAINSSHSKVVRGYTTAIDSIVSYAIEHHIELVSHPTFITGGEVLLDSLRRKIIDDIHCNVISQYANEENGVFGQSEINGKGTSMTLNRSNCFIEILKLDSDEPVTDGELGRIVVTDFTNYAMPMIRYDIGDVASIGKVQNGILMTLENLVGRKTDMIYDTSGKRVDLFNSISPEIYNNIRIKQWQFIQETEKAYELRLATEDKDVLANPKHFELLMKELLGADANVKITFLKEIPVLSSGKRKIVICKYKK